MWGDAYGTGPSREQEDDDRIICRMACECKTRGRNLRRALENMWKGESHGYLNHIAKQKNVPPAAAFRDLRAMR
jgi:hypothetical protein